MIDPEKRKAIFSLHEEGMGAREISLHLKVSRNTVRTVINFNPHNSGAGVWPASPGALRPCSG